MGLWSAIKAVGTGDFANAGNYLFTSEDDIATKVAVDNYQEQLVKTREAEGLISEDKAMGYLNDIQRNAYPVLWDTYGSPSEAFKDSVTEQVKKFPGNIAGSIPWYIWAILILAMLVYLAPYLTPLRRR